MFGLFHVYFKIINKKYGLMKKVYKVKVYPYEKNHTKIAFQNRTFPNPLNTTMQSCNPPIATLHTHTKNTIIDLEKPQKKQSARRHRPAHRPGRV